MRELCRQCYSDIYMLVRTWRRVDLCMLTWVFHSEHSVNERKDISRNWSNRCASLVNSSNITKT